MRNFAKMGAVAMLLSAASGVAGAQTWQAIGSTTGAGPQFWNNPSQDQAGAGACNVGSILTNPALTPASCSSEAPANLLPLSPSLTVAPTSYLSNGSNGSRAFVLGAGLWQIQLLGTVTGASPVRPWTINGSFGSATITTTGNLITVLSSTAMYFDLNAFAPVGNIYRSDDPTSGSRQFAVFSNQAVGGPASTAVATLGGALGTTYYIGMEDNACVLGQTAPCPNDTQRNPANYGGVSTPNLYGDYDYNDMIVKATVVPEPSSVALMMFGLAGVAFAARKRRSA
jgi:hypothetical protein